MPPEEREKFDQDTVNMIKYLSDMTKYLSDKVAKLETRQEFPMDYAFLDITEKGYAIVKSTIGDLMICVDDAQPYADGYKVKIRIGNPLAATLTNTEIYTVWRSAEGKDFKIHDKKFQVSDPLHPGTWTKTELILCPCTPEGAKIIKISIQTTGVSLRPSLSKNEN